MIVQLGLLFATYIGSKLIDAIREEERALETEVSHGPTIATTTSMSLSAPQQAMTVQRSQEPTDAQQLRYLQVALLSVGLFAVRFFVPAALPLGMVAYLYSAVPYMKNVERSIVRDRRVNVDVLFFVADALTLGVGSYFTAGVGLSMIHAGRHMVKRAKADSAKMVTHLFKELPDSVWIRIDGVETLRPLAEVQVGDLVVLGSGSVVPVDGVVIEGVAQVDQSSLTGESQPAEKGAEDSVFANTIVTSGRLVIRVGRSGADTTSAQIADALLNAVNFKTGVQLKGEKWADSMSLPMLVSAAAILPFGGPVSAAVLINAHIGARILVSAPVTTLNHIREASMLGVLVKDGRALERLCDVDTILFDKTGTLTTSELEVTRVDAFGAYSAAEILQYAATAERKLQHPIAKAVLRRAERDGVSPLDPLDADYTIGYGVSVVVAGRLIRVGSHRFMSTEGLAIDGETQSRRQACQAAGNTFILVAVDDCIQGALELEAQPRPEVFHVIERLKALGISRMAIVSGDDEAPTRRLARDLGLAEYFHNVLPGDKARIVEELRAAGRVVCFVGDGINDSIALQSADVAMSIAGASSIAKDVAEIVFVDGSLRRLAEVVELSHRLNTNLRRSLAICLVPSGVNLVGAFFPQYNVLTALLLNNVFSTLGVSTHFYARKRAVATVDEAPGLVPAAHALPLSGDEVVTEVEAESRVRWHQTSLVRALRTAIDPSRREELVSA